MERELSQAGYGKPEADTHSQLLWRLHLGQPFLLKDLGDEV